MIYQYIHVVGYISIYWFCWYGFWIPDRFLAIQTFVTIQFCYWLNRELKLLCLPSNLGEKNAAQGSLSKTFNVLPSWAKATMGRNQHALYQTQCMHFFTPPSLSNYVANICLVAFIELHGVHGSLVVMYLFSRSAVSLNFVQNAFDSPALVLNIWNIFFYWLGATLHCSMIGQYNA